MELMVLQKAQSSCEYLVVKRPRDKKDAISERDTRK